MVTQHKLSKLAGPSAVFSGYTLLVFGAIATYFSFMAIPLILLGGIMVFSYAEVFTDAEGKQYKYQVKLFGLIPIGSYKKFQSGDEIRLKHLKGKYYTYSRSNRESSVAVDDYRVYLIGAGTNKKIMLGKFSSEKEAKEQVDRLTEIILSVERENGRVGE